MLANLHLTNKLQSFNYCCSSSVLKRIDVYFMEVAFRALRVMIVFGFFSLRNFVLWKRSVLEIILVTEMKCLLPPNLSKGKIVFLNRSKV